MGLFKDRLPDLSAIEVHETMTQQLFISKTSSSSVFDRLVSDTNRRANASMKVQDYRLMLELEYENSFLNPVKISRKNETNLITRLLQDSERRKSNKQAVENLKKSQTQITNFIKWPAEKTAEVVSRLSTDKRSQIEKRTEIKNSIFEKELKALDSIRNKRHPRRKLDKDVVGRILGSASPECKCGEPKQEMKKKKSWKEINRVVERLHRPSPVRVVINEFSSSKKISPPKLARPVGSPLKGSNLETDDYLMTLKAKGKGFSYK